MNGDRVRLLTYSGVFVSEHDTAKEALAEARKRGLLAYAVWYGTLCLKSVDNRK